MAALIRLCAVGLGLAVFCPSIAQTPSSSPESVARTGENINRWQPMIAAASVRFGVPQSWIKAVMMAESGGRTHIAGRPIVSKAGAMGLMQLMPATWSALRIRHGLGSDAHDPYDNIMAGTAYLRAMYDQFGYPGLFAAYNAGPARYTDHLRTGEPLPGETRRYVAQLAGSQDVVDRPEFAARRSGLFFALGSRVVSSGELAHAVETRSVLVPTRSANEAQK